MVELREHYGVNIATGQRIYLNQFRIILDGRAVGYVRDEPGGKISLVERVSSVEREEIEHVMRCDSREIKEAPNVPGSVMEPEGGEDFDDFD